MGNKLYQVNDVISWIEENVGGLDKALVVFPTERMLEAFMEVHGKTEEEEYFFSHDVFPFEEIGTSPRIMAHRISMLRRLLTGELKRVFGSFHGLLRKTIPLDLFSESTIKVVKNEAAEIGENILQQLGYRRTFNVTVPGEFSIRGGITDVFVPGNSYPFRIETFDKEVESIRTFDTVDQKSISFQSNVLITPATESILTQECRDLAVRRIEFAQKATGSTDELLMERIDTMDTVAGIFYEKQNIAMDYLEDYETFIVRPDEGFAEFARRERETNELLSEKPVRRFLYVRYGGVSSEIFHRLANYTLVSDSPVSMMPYEAEISEKVSVSKTVRRKEEILPRIPVIDWTELEEGDLIVHKEYGIGRYLGVSTVENILGVREYLVLEYRDNNKIYVPVDRVDRVHKYVGNAEGIQLSSLKGTGWSRQKSKVKREVKLLVSELSKLYGSREMSAGLALSGDLEIEKSFWDSFPYMETEDQQKAFEEVLSDLQSDRSMDRLVSGDAGYGKTEVAIRAVFRCVVSGKQSAVMVPTTVLARQHYETFYKRLTPFGVRVEIIDRYRTDTERRKLLERLRKGEADVIIGTHSLLSSEVQFADLGLLVIDEEQLFGVLQKEHFKKLRLQVNILSMSATPIPRTLYMSLSGLRDLSIISTPPLGRSSPEIYVGALNDRLIRTAVLRETNRGGQTIYVHNRVNELPSLMARLKQLLPEIRIEMAHGQMNKVAFERTIRSFYNGDIDLLLCTTIIESGVDVPNANTIIVDDSHRYGLAQLYQLRGRVGRSNRRAFAYFLYDSRRLTGPSKDRLKALKEFSGSGSGLKIAMRDLEIRGFGTLLGAEQHGNINAIGLYLYREMVERAMREIRGEKEEISEDRSVDTELKNIPFDMVIPESYVSDSIERLKIYRRIAACKEFDDLQSIEEELKDRFGRLPMQVHSLLTASRIRLGAFKMHLKSIEYDIHSESLIMYHGENYESGSLKTKRNKVVVNEREGKTVIYGVPERRLMNLLTEVFLRVEGIPK